MRARAYLFQCLCLCALQSAAVAQESKHEVASTDADELRACLRAGMGVGWRGIELPSEQGLQKLDSDYFPALDLGVQGAVALTPAFSLGFEARYQTSIGLQARETPAGGVEKSTNLRSNDAQLGIVPGLRFADAPDAVTLALLLGWEVRGLRSVVELSTPSYTLHGPLIRAQLVIPFARILELRLAPEFTYILSVTEELREQAALRGGGTGVGGELALAVRATRWLGFELGYRETHVWAPTYFSQSFTDGGRYVTLRSVLEY